MITVEGIVQDFSAVPGNRDVFYLLVDGVRYVCDGTDDGGNPAAVWKIAGHPDPVPSWQLAAWLLGVTAPVKATLSVDQEGSFTVGEGSFEALENTRGSGS